MYVVRWDNPELEPRHSIDPVAIVKREVFKDYKVGDAVLSYYSEDCMWYPGVVEEARPDGSFRVRWDVPEDGLDEICVYPTHMKFPRLSADNLEIGRKYRGTVQSVQEYGAFVDIGADALGLLHVSAMAGTHSRVESAHDLVTEGEDIDVWMAGFKSGKIVLSQRPGGKSTRNLRPFAAASPEQWQAGVVKATARYGAFVTVSLDDNTADGLVPIQEISNDFIRSVDDVLKPGQKVSVRILSVDVVAGKMMLTMKGEKKAADFNVTAFVDVPPQTWMSGKVVHVTDTGAFVRLEHAGSTADGYLHASQFGDRSSVREQLGKEIRVRIVQVNPERNRMTLSALPLGEEERPEFETASRAPSQPTGLVEDLRPFKSLKGQWLPGVVKQLRRNGVQVAVVSKTGTYGVGMVFMNQIQEGFVNRLEDVLSPGQEVRVQVLAVNLQRKQMTLSMKNSYNSHKKQDVSPFAGVSPTEWFPGTVEKVRDYGSFVSVRNGKASAEGLVRSPQTIGELSPGDVVEVRVLGVDVAKGSMRLSMQPPLTATQTGDAADG